MKTRILAISLAALLMTFVGVGCTATSTNPNVALFSVGDTVGAASKQQFISIATDHEWSIEVEYTAPEDLVGWCKLSSTSGTGNANVFMVYGENTLDVDRSITLIVHFAGEDATLHFTQRSASAQTKPEDLKGWLELPTFEADGERYYFSKHMLPSENNRQRSFSVLYDSENFHPLWVAYPLCRGNMYGNGQRTNDWGILDPNLPADKQLYMSSSYYGSYDRGHMLPSACRLRSNDDNRQTFYPTNMSPQLAGLNQQKWAGIEGQVRDWAEGCDTLYVVTGAVFRTVGGSENIAYTNCRSDNSKDVAIPNYYYKALLQLRITNGSKSYDAMAIWVPHKAASGKATWDDVITIDELETRTGVDFFSNLEDGVESLVEARKADSGIWSGL